MTDAKIHTPHNNDDQQELPFASSSSPLDSPTSQINDLLDEKLEAAFHMQTSQVILHDLAKIAIEHDPIDLAYAVTRLPTSVRHVVFQNLPDLEAKVTFIINVSTNSRVAIFRQTPDTEIVRLVDKWPQMMLYACSKIYPIGAVDVLLTL